MAKKDKGATKKKKADKDDDKPDILAALAQTARSGRTVLSRHLLESGLYAGQDSVMLALSEKDGLTLSEIAGSLGVRAPTITKTINRMAAQGFVTRRQSAADRRTAHVHLTDAGRDAITAIRDAVRRSEEEAAAGMSAKELKTLHKLLRRIDTNLQGQTPAAGGV